jgi:hypothetical protein
MLSAKMDLLIKKLEDRVSEKKEVIHIQDSRMTCELCGDTGQTNGYISMKGSSSNMGWHQRWFYLRSDADAPLPSYTGCFFEEAPER